MSGKRLVDFERSATDAARHKSGNMAARAARRIDVGLKGARAEEKSLKMVCAVLNMVRSMNKKWFSKMNNQTLYKITLCKQCKNTLEMFLNYSR